MPSSVADLVVLDTLSKLQAHGHGLFGYCRPCQRHFDVPIPVLIAARGTDNRQPRGRHAAGKVRKTPPPRDGDSHHGPQQSLISGPPVRRRPSRLTDRRHQFISGSYTTAFSRR